MSLFRFVERAVVIRQNPFLGVIAQQPISRCSVAHASTKKPSVKPGSSLPAVISHDHLSTMQGIFRDMAEIRALQGEQFRSASYSKALATIAQLRTEFVSAEGVPRDELLSSAGFGGRMLDKVAEVVSSADGKTLKEHAELMSTPFAQSARFVMSVNGFGPKAAAAIAKEHEGKIRTIDDLTAIGAKHKFTNQQLLGMKYYDDSRLRIPRDEVARHEALLLDRCAEVDPQLRMTVCGSYRRELPTSGDVDCLLSWGGDTATEPQTDLMQDLVDRLDKTNYTVGMIGHGSTKVMAYARLDDASRVRRLDIRWVSPEAFPTALLYFTGSAEFNARMRGIALARGFTLNEYGLFHLASSKKKESKAKPRKPNTAARGEERVPVSSERDIFARIGMDWVDPRDRVR